MSLASIVSQVYAKVPYTPEIGIVCGSGLGGLATEISNKIEMPYDTIAGFPSSEVPGHANQLVFGDLGGKKVIAMQGRFHFYEGWSPKDCVKGIQLMCALGVKTIIVTNAAGALDRSFKVGDLMLIEDHIAFLGMAGNNPLVGPNDASVGPRFPSISSAYDAKLGATFAEVYAKQAAATGHDHELRRGCYVGVSGPTYESRHEIEAFRVMGAHAVGMSTVMEVVAAAHAGIKVLGLSLITNSCLGTHPDEYNLPEPNHAEVVAETKKVESFVQNVVKSFIAEVDLSDRPTAAIAAQYGRNSEAVRNAVIAAPAAEASTGKCTRNTTGKVCVWGKAKFFASALGAGIIGGAIGALLVGKLTCHRRG